MTQWISDKEFLNYDVCLDHVYKRIHSELTFLCYTIVGFKETIWIPLVSKSSGVLTIELYIKRILENANVHEAFTTFEFIEFVSEKIRYWAIIERQTLTLNSFKEIVHRELKSAITKRGGSYDYCL